MYLLEALLNGPVVAGCPVGVIAPNLNSAVAASEPLASPILVLEVFINPTNA
jgi:hypothetical protein